MHLNRDVVVGLVLLIVCGVFIQESFSIQEPLFGQMSSALWPRLILVPLTLLSAVFFVRSLLHERSPDEQRGGVAGWFRYYMNPIVVFVFFFIFLASMPVLGMLIGGFLFVFVTLSYLGGWSAPKLLTHTLIAIFTVGGMWSIFTFGLGVILPRGELLPLL